MTAPKIEAIELEDFEHARPCTPWTFDCGKEAEWLAISTCCGFEMPLCDPHRWKCEEETREIHADSGACCQICGAEGPIADARFVRIK
jgi:hypothetical protein